MRRLRQSDQQRRYLQRIVDLIRANPEIPVIFGDGLQVAGSKLEDNSIKVILEQLPEKEVNHEPDK